LRLKIAGLARSRGGEPPSARAPSLESCAGASPLDSRRQQRLAGASPPRCFVLQAPFLSNPRQCIPASSLLPLSLLPLSLLPPRLPSCECMCTAHVRAVEECAAEGASSTARRREPPLLRGGGIIEPVAGVPSCVIVPGYIMPLPWLTVPPGPLLACFLPQGKLVEGMMEIKSGRACASACAAGLPAKS
jgi:hypothetical protein